ncbi:AsnC family protein, partial [Pseudomonas aeruginosa]
MAINLKEILAMNKLDRYDLRILEELQRDARISNQELAERIGLSPSPC